MCLEKVFCILMETSEASGLHALSAELIDGFLVVGGEHTFYVNTGCAYRLAPGAILHAGTRRRPVLVCL